MKLLLVNVLLSVFLYSGMLFGWAPLQKLLLSEHNGFGQFDELCQNQPHLNTTRKPCPAQLNQLNLVYTLGTFTLSLVSLPGGWFLDTYGVRATVFFSGIFQISGMLLFGFSDSVTFNWFIPGAIAMAAGGFLIMVASFPVSFLFPIHQTAILAAVSCLFDASSLTFAIFDVLVTKNSLSRCTLFLCYSGFAAFVYLFLILQWSWVSTPSGGKHDTVENCDNMEEVAVNDDKAEEGQGNDDHPNPNPTMWDEPLTNQLKSFEFGFILIFCSIQQLRANTYIGLNDLVLLRMGDTTGHYTNIFGYALPSGIFFIPLIDICMVKLGLVGALHTTNVLGVVYGVLVLFQDLPVQIATFLAFTGYRAFLYSVMSTFNAQVFGLKTLGRITGFVFTSSAVFQLLQYPIVNSIETVFQKDPFWPQVGLVSISSICICFTVWFQCRRAGQPTERGQQSNVISYNIQQGIESPLISGRRESSAESSSSQNQSLRRASSFLRSPSKHVPASRRQMVNK